MVVFEAFVRRQKSVFGLYGVILSKNLGPLIDKKCKIKVVEIKD